jgi:hypothetical protein
MWKPFLVALAIAAFLLGDSAVPQESKKEQPAKPLEEISKKMGKSKKKK